MKVIPGPSSPQLGSRIAEKLGVEAHPVDHRLFPDGESYIRITTQVEGEVAVVIQTTFPETDRSLLQLFLMVDAVRDLGAGEIVCIVPYLAYARQDKRFLDGEVVSLDTVTSLLEAAGVDELVVIDVHNEKSLETILEGGDMKTVNLSAIPLLAKYLKAKGFEGAYSLSPDQGAVNLAEAAAEVLGGGSGFFEKKRDRRTGEIEMLVKGINLEGRDAVVFDDIVSSGGTTARAVRGLKEQGASRVAAACTHGLFMGDAENRIREAGADIILSTDTVQSPLSHVTVAGPLVDYLRTRSSP
ncbi:MAG: ribose-phosphate diphosphokinase [Candidatus Bathyarchaeota archaeon]|jgi:ribose-phosphate pyrophosphokinase